MNEKLIETRKDFVAVTRNPDFLHGKKGSSHAPFAVAIRIGKYSRVFPQPTLDEAARVARQISDERQLIILVEKGL